MQVDVSRRSFKTLCINGIFLDLQADTVSDINMVSKEAWKTLGSPNCSSTKDGWVDTCCPIPNETRAIAKTPTPTDLGSLCSFLRSPLSTPAQGYAVGIVTCMQRGFRESTGLAEFGAAADSQ
ncbi:hypothetical protein ACTXT7_017202 [Hymenolepis weldensis]